MAGPEIQSAGVEVPPQQQTRMELADLQKEVESTLTDEERMELQKNSFVDTVREFFAGSKMPKFVESIALWLAERFSDSTDTLTDEEVFGATKDAEREAKIESAFIAHRGLGYELGSDKQNSLEAMEEAMKKGEGEIEFDVRLIGGELYLKHDAPGENNDTTDLPTFKQVLELFQKYPSAKMFIDVKGGKVTAQKIIDEIKQADQEAESSADYTPLMRRTTFISFNPKALQVASQSLPSSPLMFAYFPTKGIPFAEEQILPFVQSGAINRDQILQILKGADNVVDNGSDDYVCNFEACSMYINGQNIDRAEREEEFHTYSLLPPDSILEMIRKSGGAVAVPWALVRNLPEFFTQAKAAGVKVAIHGFGTPEGDGYLIAKHNAGVKKAIAMGANIIITDHPNIIQ